jgi:UDP-glucose 4-epimerase
MWWSTRAHFGGKAPAEIQAAEDVNVIGTLKLCQAAVRAKVQHFVFISTIFATLNDDSEHYTAYAFSKKHAEDVARFVCAKNGLPLTVLRPSQIYGSWPKLRVHQPFLHLMMERARKGEDILLYGSRDASRNFVHIDDLAVVISAAVQRRVVGTYSCQHPSDVTYSRVANAALGAYGAVGAVRFLTDKSDVGDNVFPIDSTLYDTLGLRPQTTIEDGLKRLAQAIS